MLSYQKLHRYVKKLRRQRQVSMLAVLGISVYLLLNSLLAVAASPTQELTLASKDFSGLRKAVDAGEIAKLTVYYIMEGTLTSMAVTEESMTKSYEYKLECPFSSPSPLSRSLSEGIKNTKLSVNVWGRGDFRWGCVYYDQDGTAVARIFYDPRFGCVSIDGHRAKLSGGYYDWLKTHFKTIFDSLQ